MEKVKRALSESGTAMTISAIAATTKLSDATVRKAVTAEGIDAEDAPAAEGPGGRGKVYSLA